MGLRPRSKEVMIEMRSVRSINGKLTLPFWTLQRATSALSTVAQKLVEDLSAPASYPTLVLVGRSDCRRGSSGRLQTGKNMIVTHVEFGEDKSFFWACIFVGFGKYDRGGRGGEVLGMSQ